MMRKSLGLRRCEGSRRSLAHITGDSVRATTVDIITLTAMVTVNWR